MSQYTWYTDHFYSTQVEEKVINTWYFILSQQKTIYGRRKLSLPCRMSGKTKYKTRTDEDVAFLINTAFVSKAYTYNHGDSMRHWDTIT